MHNKSQISSIRQAQDKNLKFQINTNILEQIIEKTREEVQKRKRHSGEQSASRIRSVDSENADSGQARMTKNSFESAISAPKNGELAFIAEIKLASPSEPQLGSEEDVQVRSKQYEEAGADAISIVTEKHFFKGDVSFVTKIKEAVSVPILQKDFVIDEYQIYEAKKIGADAILLIARLVHKERLIDFVDLAFSLSLDPVVEVHNESDLEKAVATPTGIIAVNARDLDTMEISIDKACELLKKIPEQFMKLGFSGISSRNDVEKYKKVAVDGVLIGTSLMKAANIQEFLGGLR